MSTYAALAILAGFTLDGIFRIATLVISRGIRLKNLSGVLKDRVGLSLRHIPCRIILGPI